MAIQQTYLVEDSDGTLGFRLPHKEVEKPKNENVSEPAAGNPDEKVIKKPTLVTWMSATVGKYD